MIDRLIPAARLYCIFWLAGFAATAAGQAVPEPLGKLPATFEGELPCADCPGIFYHLDLLPDDVVFLRTTFLGRGTGAIRDQLGSWRATGGTIHIALAGDGPSDFLIKDRDTLTVLDGTGLNQEVSVGHDLRRKDFMGIISPRLAIRGMFDRRGEGWLIDQCSSKLSFNVSSGRYLEDLQRALTDSNPHIGSGLLIEIEGAVSYQSQLNNGGAMLTIRPEKIIDMWPGKECPAETIQD